jgi:hypothetical protein
MHTASRIAVASETGPGATLSGIAIPPRKHIKGDCFHPILWEEGKMVQRNLWLLSNQLFSAGEKVEKGVSQFFACCHFSFPI